MPKIFQLILKKKEQKLHNIEEGGGGGGGGGWKVDEVERGSVGIVTLLLATFKI